MDQRQQNNCSSLTSCQTDVSKSGGVCVDVGSALNLTDCYWKYSQQDYNTMVRRQQAQRTDALLQNDCRCVNGVWTGGACALGDVGNSCLPANASLCSADSAKCSGPNDTVCCSCFCGATPYGYYCQSQENIIAAAQQGSGARKSPRNCVTGSVR